MDFQRYFQEELNYLRETGEEFSREFPKLAPFLARKGNDPDVERILEGFAFFSAKLRQKIDDDLPEFSQGLTQLLWPHYLRPVPSVSILRFSSKGASAITSAKHIPRGTPVGSTQVQGVSMTFRTCYNVEFLPLDIKQVELKNAGTISNIDIDLALTSDSRWESIGMDALRFYLNADANIASMLYLWIFQYLTRVEVWGGSGLIETLSPRDIKAVGFAADEEVIPYQAAAHEGHRYWQEYFVIPQKFMFFDVAKMGDIARRFPGERSFKLILRFSRAFPSTVRITDESFLLNCTPIINLFSKDAEPIRLDHERIQYRLRADENAQGNTEIFEVNSVSGWIQGTKQRRVYRPFISFDRSGSNNDFFYEIRRVQSMNDKSIETYLSFLYPPEESNVSEKEVISVEMTCTNGNLPSILREGDVCVAIDGSPEFANFSNILPATPSYPPQIGKNTLWQLISNLAPNYTSLSNIETLRSVLMLYNTPALHNAQAARTNEMRMSGIDSVESRQSVIMRKGLPIRGIRTHVDAFGAKFGGVGELFVFFSILSEYLGVYVAINAFSQLEVMDKDSGEVYLWQAKSGSQPLL